jgi:hypothetical protein
MTLRNSLTQMRRANYEFAGNARYSKPALNDLDRKLGRYLTRRRGIFVEAGANHALTQSNPYYLQRFLRWSGLLGLLVEAIPALYQRATRRRPHECSTALWCPFKTRVRKSNSPIMSGVHGTMGSPETSPSIFGKSKLPSK